MVFDATEDPTTGAPRPSQLTEDPTTGTLQSVQNGDPLLLLSTLSQSGSLTKLGNARRERKKERNNICFLCLEPYWYSVKRFVRLLYQISTTRLGNTTIIGIGFSRQIA